MATRLDPASKTDSENKLADNDKTTLFETGPKPNLNDCLVLVGTARLLTQSLEIEGELLPSKTEEEQHVGTTSGGV